MCCEQDDDCDDADDACTADACVNGTCVYTFLNQPDCCQETVLEESFDAPISYGAFSYSPPFDSEPGWQITSDIYVTAPNSLWFGAENTGNYDNGSLPASGIIQTNAPLQIDSLSFTTLSFWIYLANEFAYGDYANADFDRVRVLAYPLSASSADSNIPELLTLWDSAWMQPIWWKVDESQTPIGPQWTHIEGLDLTPYAGYSIGVDIIFHTLDGFSNDYPGVYIDDLRIEQTCTTAAPAIP